MERRTSPRYRVHKEGRLCLASRTMTHLCRIRDLSATGARLDVRHDSLLPADGILEVDTLELGFPIRLRWRRGTECGVEFTGSAFSISA
jgi:hypothetical protein